MDFTRDFHLQLQAFICKVLSEHRHSPNVVSSVNTCSFPVSVMLGNFAFQQHDSSP
jgi:hypothetical protein